MENYKLVRQGWENLLPDNDPLKDMTMLKLYASMLSAIEGIHHVEPVPSPSPIIIWLKHNGFFLLKLLVVVIVVAAMALRSNAK